MKVAEKYAPDVSSAYDQAFEAAATQAPPQIHVIGLGAGGAKKERSLIEQLLARGKAVQFTPLDVSESLALISAHHVGELGIETPRPVVADLLQFPDAPTWLDEFDDGQPRLFTAFGLTPNTTPSELMPRLLNFLRPNDQLLVSANLAPAGKLEPVLSDYDNPETRSWLTQLLLDWGVRDLLSAPEFSLGSLDGQTAILANACWQKSTSFEWEDQQLQVSMGDSLRLFYSIRYTPERFEERLNADGFSVMSKTVSTCDREGIWLTQREGQLTLLT